MHQVNNGVPANSSGGRLFDAAAVTVNASISDSFVTLVSAMNSFEEYFRDTNDIVQETTDSGLRLWWSQLPDDVRQPATRLQAVPGTPASPPRLQPSGVSTEVLTSLITKISEMNDSKTSDATGPTKKELEDNFNTFYGLLFGWNDAVEDGDGQGVLGLKLAPVSDRAKAILREPKASRPKLFRELFLAFRKAQSESDSHVDRSATITADSIDSTFVSAVCSCNWLDQPLAAATTSLVSDLSAVHFCTVDLGTATFEERCRRDLNAYLEERASLDRSKMSKRDTHLYFAGLQTGKRHVCECIFNIATMGKFLSDDFRKSSLAKSLDALVRILDDDDGKKWLHLLEQFPHPIHCLIMQVQNILARYVAIAKDTDNRRRAKEGLFVDHGPLQAAEGMATWARDRIKMHILNMSSTPFMDTPITFHLFPGLVDAASAPTPGTSKHNSSSAATSGAPSKKRDGTSPSDPNKRPNGGNKRAASPADAEKKKKGCFFGRADPIGSHTVRPI
jgi:hypothetical protein